MKSKLLILLILIHVFLHLFSTKGGNFYFTVDQGRDALNVREILERGRFILEGPRTGAIEKLFAGPYWYYLIAPGFWLSGGDPWGAVVVMVIINTVALVVVFNLVRKYVNLFYSFLITSGLLVLEHFWFASQYSFNPHLLPLITIVFVISLLKAYEGKRNYLILAFASLGFVIHSELAFIPVIFIPLIIVSIILFVNRKIFFRQILWGLLILLLFLLPHLVSELSHDFSQSRAVFRALLQPKGIIGGSSVGELLQEFSKTTIPQNKVAGLFVFTVSLILVGFFVRKGRCKNSYSFLFKVTILIFLVSIIWFATNKEFLPWHVLGLYPLIFVVVMLGLALVPNIVSRILFFLILFAQIGNFMAIYPGQVKVSSDHGLFIQQVNAVDWIFKESDSRGFYLYSYLPSVYDYTYQYLVWWRGTKKYGYLPCEYATYPQVPSSLYFSAIEYYQSPQRECAEIRFLIIEPTQDKGGFETWYKGVTNETLLIEEKYFGDLKVEKRIFD